MRQKGRTGRIRKKRERGGEVREEKQICEKHGKGGAKAKNEKNNKNRGR